MSSADALLDSNEDVKRIYSFNLAQSKLLWRNFRTGQHSSLLIKKAFRFSVIFIELPGSSLLFCGGLSFTYGPSKEAIKIDDSREFATIELPQMIASRSNHSLNVHQGSVYAICGRTVKCEKLSLESLEWESLPDHPKPYSLHATIISGNSIFTFDGAGAMEAVKLNLGEGEWEVLGIDFKYQFNNPYFISSSDPDTVFFIVKTSLTSLHLKTLKRSPIGSNAALKSNFGLVTHGESIVVQGLLYMRATQGIEVLDLLSFK
mmetsp:Transcript_4211/g.8440  ORF Transcript_4211/g.8440 Transcript_4211/m.8440 type:complete len:261 (+) Transcript_4211:345-1127(+)